MTIKRITFLFFAAILVFTAGCATTPKRGTLKNALSSLIVSIDKKDYVPLSVVASYYRANCEWDPISKRVNFIKDNKSFIFCVGFDYAVVNGRPERLSGPVTFYEGAVAIPADFALERIGKLLGAPSRITDVRPPVAQRYLIRRVVIDAGHGGKDPGAVGKAGLREKDVVLDITKRIKQELNENGIEVIMTRDRDIFVSLDRRSQIANERGADFFVSIHANAARLRGARGFEVYYLSDAVDDNARAVEAAENSFLKIDDSSFHLRNTSLEATIWDLVYTENREESIELAKYITGAVDDSTSLKNRGVKSARFCVLRGTQMPAVLVEVGFLSNPIEEKNLKSPYYRQAIASAIAKGILNYRKVYEETDGFTQ